MCTASLVTLGILGRHAYRKMPADNIDRDTPGIGTTTRWASVCDDLGAIGEPGTELRHRSAVGSERLLGQLRGRDAQDESQGRLDSVAAGAGVLRIVSRRNQCRTEWVTGVEADGLTPGRLGARHGSPTGHRSPAGRRRRSDWDPATSP